MAFSSTKQIMTSCYNGTMKSQKSKATPIPTDNGAVLPVAQLFQGKKIELTAKQIRLLNEEKIRKKAALKVKIIKGIGQFFTVLFILAVIFSMVLVPLLVIFN